MVDFLGIEIPLPEFMDNEYGAFVILLAMWILLAVVVALVLRYVMRALFMRTETDLDDRILEIVEKPTIALVFIYGAIRSLSVLDKVTVALEYSLTRLFIVVAGLIIVYLAYKVFRAVFIPMGRRVLRAKERDVQDSLLPLVDKVGGALIIVLGLMWVLTLMNVNVTVFLASIGAAGLVLAFALQDTLSNFFSGLHLMLDRPFKVGDTLQIGEDYMEVRKVGFRSTRLYNIFAHEMVSMPNNMVANTTIVNLTEPDLHYRIKVEVGVAYGSPVEKVKSILREAVENVEGIILDDPEKTPSFRFTSFGDSSLNFRTFFFIEDVFDQWRIGTEVREYIDRRFREEGITIPFPQRTVSFLGQQEGQELRMLTEDSRTPPVVPPASPG